MEWKYNVESTTITVNTKSVKADTFHRHFSLCSQAHIQHLTTNATKISRDLSYSSNPSFWLLGLPDLKIWIPTEKFYQCECDQLQSALTYIFLRTQLKGFQLKFSWTLCLFAVSVVGRFALISGKKLWKGCCVWTVLEELLARVCPKKRFVLKANSSQGPTELLPAE